MSRLGLDIDDLEFGVDDEEEEKRKSTKYVLDGFEEDDDDDVDIEPVINTKERYIEDQSPPHSKQKGNNNKVETEEYEEEEEETEDEAIKKTAKLAVIIGVVVLIVCLVVLVPLSRKMKNRSRDSAKSTTTNSITSNIGTAGATSNTNQDTDTDTDTQGGNSSSSGYTSLLDNNSSTGGYTSTGTDSGWTKLDSLINCKTEKYGKLKITSISYYAKIIGESVQIKGVAQGKLDGTTGLFEVQIPNNKLNTVSVGKTISVKYKQGIQGSTPVICDIELI